MRKRAGQCAIRNPREILRLSERGAQAAPTSVKTSDLCSRTYVTNASADSNVLCSKTFEVQSATMLPASSSVFDEESFQPVALAHFAPVTFSRYRIHVKFPLLSVRGFTSTMCSLSPNFNSQQICIGQTSARGLRVPRAQSPEPESQGPGAPGLGPRAPGPGPRALGPGPWGPGPRAIAPRARGHRPGWAPGPGQGPAPKASSPAPPRPQAPGPRPGPRAGRANKGPAP